MLGTLQFAGVDPIADCLLVQLKLVCQLANREEFPLGHARSLAPRRYTLRPCLPRALTAARCLPASTAGGHSLDHVELSPPTPDDVPRVKLDGPPATADQIDAAFRRGPERKARK